VEAGLDVQWFASEHDWIGARERLLAARCVIFCWSRAATDQAESYRLLAAEALARGIAISIEFEPGTRPTELSAMTTYAFGGRRTGLARLLAGRLFLNDIVVAAKYKAAGQDPPPPTAPRKLLFRQAWVGVVAIGSVAATLSAPAQLYQSIPWPRFQEERAWAAIPPGSCAALAAFRRDFPDGRHAAKAAAVLANPGEIVRQQWRILSQDLPITIDVGTDPNARIGRTREARARTEMELLCNGYAQAAGGTMTAMRLLPHVPGAASDSFTCVVRAPDPQVIRRCDLDPR
jgi:hypothetical protein